MVLIFVNNGGIYVKKCVSFLLVLILCVSFSTSVFGLEVKIIADPNNIILDVEAIDPNNKIRNFIDIDESHWAYKEFESMVNSGVISGVSTIRLGPDENLTREQFVTILCRNMTGGNWEVSESPYYVDVPVFGWFSGAVEWSRNYNVAKGVGENLFGVGQSLTKEQMIQMIYNYSINNDIALKSVSVIDDPVKDMELVSDWAFSGVTWGNLLGLLVKDSDGNYNPKETATRADMVVTLYRFNELLEE